MNKLIRNNYLILAIFTICIALLCLGSSPFINIITNDSAIFMQIGRSMASGKICYRDIFDHKGFNIYLLNYLGALISSKTTVGVFLIETIFLYIDLLFLYKLFKLIIKDRKTIILTLLVITCLILNCLTYQYGNFTETYVLTLEIITIYYVHKRFINNSISNNMLLIFGICVGVAFNFKASNILIWIPLFIVLVVKEYKHIYKIILFFFLGALISFIPTIIYCLINNCFYDYFYASILVNILYSSSGSLLTSIINTITNIRTIWLLILCFFSIIVVIKKVKNKYIKIIYCLSLLFCFINVSLSGRAYGHYYEELIPFTLPFVIFITEYINNLKWFKLINNKVIYLICLLIILLVNFSIPIKLFKDNFNFYNGTIEKEMANIYQNKYSNCENILVTYMNPRFYIEMNVNPTIKYFITPSLGYSNFPYAVDEQIDSIMSLDNEIIIISYNDINNELDALLKENYVLEKEIIGYDTYDMYVRKDIYY